MKRQTPFKQTVIAGSLVLWRKLRLPGDFDFYIPSPRRCRRRYHKWRSPRRW